MAQRAEEDRRRREVGRDIAEAKKLVAIWNSRAPRRCGRHGRAGDPCDWLRGMIAYAGPGAPAHEPRGAIAGRTGVQASKILIMSISHGNLAIDEVPAGVELRKRRCSSLRFGVAMAQSLSPFPSSSAAAPQCRSRSASTYPLVLVLHALWGRQSGVADG